MSAVNCKEIAGDLAIRRLIESGAKFYCAYCGYVLDKAPQLLVKRPRYRRRSTKMCTPIFESRPHAVLKP
jgi:hypothetical protein